MAGRFLPQRDRDFLERINKELIGDLKTNDDGIINQKIVIYKVSAYDTSTNMYGEAMNGKNFKDGIQIACIVEAEDFDYNTDEFGPDARQNASFHILRQTLTDVSLIPEIGDIIEWNFGFFEVNGVLENQLIGGQQENNWSVTLQSFLSRQSFSNMNRIRSI
jgi:hypothetical protein|tara:strand:- start:4558 stop:5043 length:486 start_codon:yes stop_codon:yes gene_type:complete